MYGEKGRNKMVKKLDTEVNIQMMKVKPEVKVKDKEGMIGWE